MAKEKMLDKVRLIIYYCFVAMMPFLIPAFFTNALHLPYFLGIASIFLLFGLLLILYSKDMSKDIINAIDKLKVFILLFAVTTLISILMLVILSYNNEISILEGFYSVIKRVLINAYSLIIIFYNYIMIRSIGINKIIKILWIESIVCLFICGLQLLSIRLNFFAELYDMINFAEILRPSSYYVRLQRISGFGHEPSTFSSFSIFISLPIFFSCILYKKKIVLNSFLAGTTCFFAYFTKSSAVYVCLFFVLCIFSIILFIKMYNKSKKWFVVTMTVFIFMGSVVFLIAKSEILRLAVKVFDLNNQSTAYRYSTVYNDILCFFKYPFLGVGNGMQGFFYNEHIESSVFMQSTSSEIINALNGVYGTLAGGAFVPSVISGYGIVGIFCIGYIFFLSIKKLKSKSFYLYLYLFSLISFMIGGCVAHGLSYNYLTLFIIAIPLSLSDDNKSFNIKYKKGMYHV